jgi:isopentenyl-diphosphate delta-isomerase
LGILLMQDEILILVDKNDAEIGTMPRSEVYAKRLSNFRVVNAFIKNSRGELWIPRRSAAKRMFPLCLDMSMGGHVEKGESYDETFVREMMEELNIDIRKTPWRTLGKITPHEHGTSAFMEVYELILEEAPNYNPDDFVEYYWLKPQAVLERLKNGDKSKGDLPVLIKHFYLKKSP